MRKPNISLVARELNLPIGTLRNRFRGLTLPRKRAHASQQLISPEAEAAIIARIEHRAKTGHPFDKRRLS